LTLLKRLLIMSPIHMAEALADALLCALGQVWRRCGW
jgi:hypothetical protein